MKQKSLAVLFAVCLTLCACGDSTSPANTVSESTKAVETIGESVTETLGMAETQETNDVEAGKNDTDGIENVEVSFDAFLSEGAKAQLSDSFDFDQYSSMEEKIEGSLEEIVAAYTKNYGDAELEVGYATVQTSAGHSLLAIEMDNSAKENEKWYILNLLIACVDGEYKIVYEDYEWVGRSIYVYHDGTVCVTGDQTETCTRGSYLYVNADDQVELLYAYVTENLEELKGDYSSYSEKFMYAAIEGFSVDGENYYALYVEGEDEDGKNYEAFKNAVASDAALSDGILIEEEEAFAKVDEKLESCGYKEGLTYEKCSYTELESF